jgi:archaellum biogenesis protein FlaJ (TadC family)
MAKYFSLFASFIFFAFFMLADIILYNDNQLHYNLVLLCIFIALTVVAGIFTVMAIYETFKHRNDKESW